MFEFLVIPDIVCIRRNTCKVIEKICNAIVWSPTHLDLSVEVYLELEDLHDIEVEVCTDVISLVTKILCLVCILGIEKTLSVQVTEINVVTCVLVSSVEDNIAVHI